MRGVRAHPERFYTTIKDVTRAYGHALERYTSAMRFGEVDKADEALARMQEIENGVTLIVRPEARI